MNLTSCSPSLLQSPGFRFCSRVNIWCFTAGLLLLGCARTKQLTFPEYRFSCRLPVGWVAYVKPEPRLADLPVYVMANGTRKAFQLYEQTESSYAVALSLTRLKAALNRPYRRLEQADSTHYWFGCRYADASPARTSFVYIITLNNKTYRLEPHAAFRPNEDLPVLAELLETLRPVEV